MKVTVGVSNHHVHLKQSDLDILFGCELTKKSDLKQPGQFASFEVVTIKTDKSEINNVRVLGPVRNYTQIEISKTDAYKLGLNPPVRSSGNLDNSEIVTLIGPNGSIKTDGCIIADRHIHITYEDKEKYYCNLRNPWLFILLMFALFAIAKHSIIFGVFALIALIPSLTYQIQIIKIRRGSVKSWTC